MVDAEERIVGVVTRRDVFEAGSATLVREVVKRPPAIVFADSSLRDAIDHLVGEGVGRLPVVSRADPRRIVGIVTRGDLVAVHARRADAARRSEPRYRVGLRQAVPAPHPDPAPSRHRAADRGPGAAVAPAADAVCLAA